MGRPPDLGGLAREFARFLREERRWWLAPILVALLGLGALIVFAGGSALGPFVYSLF